MNNEALATIIGARLRANVAQGGSGANGFGGGLYNGEQGSLTLENARVVFNGALAGRGGIGQGGGAFLNRLGTATNVQSLIARNRATTADADIAGTFNHS